MSAEALKKIRPDLSRLPDELLDSYKLIPGDPGVTPPAWDRAYDLSQLGGTAAARVPRGSRIRVPRQLYERMGLETPSIGGQYMGEDKPKAKPPSEDSQQELAAYRARSAQSYQAGSKPSGGMGRPGLGVKSKFTPKTILTKPSMGQPGGGYHSGRTPGSLLPSQKARGEPPKLWPGQAPAVPRPPFAALPGMPQQPQMPGMPSVPPVPQIPQMPRPAGQNMTSPGMAQPPGMPGLPGMPVPPGMPGALGRPAAQAGIPQPPALLGQPWRRS